MSNLSGYVADLLCEVLKQKQLCFYGTLCWLVDEHVVAFALESLGFLNQVLALNGRLNSASLKANGALTQLWLSAVLT